MLSKVVIWIFCWHSTTVQFKTAFQNLLCKTVNRHDNGNCLFDEQTPILDITTPDCAFDLPLNVSLSNTSDEPFDPLFVDNVLIYISGFLMRTLVKRESCNFCYTYLIECKDRLSCKLIEKKQRGGLICPVTDVVAIVQLANRKFETLIS